MYITYTTECTLFYIYVHYIPVCVYTHTQEIYRKEQTHNEEQNDVSCGKWWLLLEIIILDELRQCQKDRDCVFFSYVLPSLKRKIMPTYLTWM